MSTSPRPRRTARPAPDETGTPAAAHGNGDGGVDVNGDGAGATGVGAGVRSIKKYPNRRLYDTQTSSYITLVDIKDMVLACERFVVLDAKTGEDLTRSILLQIILEEETGGVPMFSTQALAQIIRFYGNSMQNMMGNYLERNIQSFIELQSRLADNPVVPLPNPMQSFMSSYMEQSQQVLAQMQEQMAKQAENLMSNLKVPTPPKPRKPE